MNTFLEETTDTDLRLAKVEAATFITPRHEIDIRANVLNLELYLPDIPESGVEITVRGPDLIVTARRPHTVRVNFLAAHLENALRDYRLVLRVGSGFDADRLRARFTNGILRLQIPAAAATRAPFRKVA
ncbi:Hsp20/alpha crystallin family protein [Nibricoccus sp. IMCC34717]|uniref:Hsp20/alpha crystallin family protein n=1 Tax=Nibricoccus sp. IMCC34717 TaxID=3034021 RepID=UPI00384DA947